VKRLYILILVFAISLSSSGLHAQIGGRGTYDFLDATVSARVAALGGSMVPIDDGDLQLTLFNPSLISSAMHHKMSLSYVDYFADINFASAQYARSIDNIGNFMAGVQFNHYGTFDYANETGQVTGEFNASDYALVLGWGRQLDSNFSIGANAKIVGSQYESYSSFGIAVDVAGSYVTKSGWLLSMTARNIGSELKSYLPTQNSMMPFSMQFGVSKRLDHVPLRFILLYDHIEKWDLTYNDPNNLHGDIDPISGLPKSKNGFEKFGDQLMRHFIVASELYIGKNLILRGGYNYNRRQELQIPDKPGMVGFSWGFGVRISKFNINYARSTYHAVGSPNYLTLNINLSAFSKN
jgi:hypothetical protein